MNGAPAAVKAALAATFIDGTRTLRLAPLIPLLVIVPEFVQHVAEIKLGMFASRDAFRALAMDPTRWTFGYFKIAGLVLAMFAAARFWGGARDRWMDLRTIAWRALLIALAINVALAIPAVALGRALTGLPLQLANLAYTVATLPALLMLIGPLLGDRTMTFSRAFTRGWLRIPLLALLLVMAFLPAQLLHGYDHKLAMGAPAALVWLLMAWDALVVGLIACWTGAALAAGYGPIDGATLPKR